ncbi:MAG: hypothetical protein H2069_03230 [Legionella sp.]|nr:hypothetical protein [Legionella sp.]
MENVQETIKETLEHFTELVNSTTPSLQEMHTLLEKILGMIVEGDGRSTEDTIFAIHLILQYRISCEDTISCLLNIDHNLLYLLGIQPSNSLKMNADRFAFAVGVEDLKQFSNLFSILASTVLKMIDQSHHHNAIYLHKHKANKARPHVIKERSKQTHSHKKHAELIEEINLGMRKIIKRESVGPVLDHVGALRGPINQFHQAIAHGLDQAKHLVNQINYGPVIGAHLNKLSKLVVADLQTLKVPDNAKKCIITQFEKLITPSKQSKQPVANKTVENIAAIRRAYPSYNK